MTAINPNTVVKAYRELENRGSIEKRAGVGTFVSEQSTGPPPDVQAALLGRLEDWASEAEAAGLDEETMEALFDVVLRRKKGGGHNGSNAN